MKINDAAKKAIDAAAASATAGKPRADKASQAAASPLQTDSIHLSGTSQALAGQAAGSGAVFDAAKVDEIKAAIANGSFRVDAGKIADGLIDSVKELIRQHKG